VLRCCHSGQRRGGTNDRSYAEEDFLYSNTNAASEKEKYQHEEKTITDANRDSVRYRKEETFSSRGRIADTDTQFIAKKETGGGGRRNADTVPAPQTKTLANSDTGRNAGIIDVTNSRAARIRNAFGITIAETRRPECLVIARTNQRLRKLS